MEITFMWYVTSRMECFFTQERYGEKTAKIRLESRESGVCTCSLFLSLKKYSCISKRLDQSHGIRVDTSLC